MFMSWVPPAPASDDQLFQKGVPCTPAIRSDWPVEKPLAVRDVKTPLEVMESAHPGTPKNTAIIAAPFFIMPPQKPPITSGSERLLTSQDYNRKSDGKSFSGTGYFAQKN